MIAFAAGLAAGFATGRCLIAELVGGMVQLGSTGICAIRTLISSNLLATSSLSVNGVFLTCSSR